MTSLGLDLVGVEAVRWVLPVEMRRHQEVLLLNSERAYHIVRLQVLIRDIQEGVKFAVDGSKGYAGFKQFVLTYGAGSLRSSLIENF